MKMIDFVLNFQPPQFLYKIQETIKCEKRKQETAFWSRKDLPNDFLRLDDYVGVMKEKVALQCFPLYSVLKALNKTTVDFLSLDVEGAEYEILSSTFEKDTIRKSKAENQEDLVFNVATIETTYLDKQEFYRSSCEMKYLMRRHGYTLHRRLGEDVIYIHKSFQMKQNITDFIF